MCSKTIFEQNSVLQSCMLRICGIYWHSSHRTRPVAVNILLVCSVVSEYLISKQVACTAD